MRAEASLDDHKTWVRGEAERVELFKNETPMALKNMATAGAQDRLWYAYTRGDTGVSHNSSTRNGKARLPAWLQPSEWRSSARSD